MTTKLTLTQRVRRLEAITDCLLDHQGDVACHIELTGKKIWTKFGESLTAHMNEIEKPKPKKTAKRGRK